MRSGTTTLYWLQCGACGGDSMSLLSAVEPSLDELLAGGLEVLWHPSLSAGSPREHAQLLRDLERGRRPLDVLCVEGAAVRGPGGTGMFDTLDGVPKKNLVVSLAARARVVVAVGTCASFGGIPATGAVEATGLQFHRGQMGGLLGDQFLSQGKLPVINLAGCPPQPEVVSSVLFALMNSEPVPLTDLNMPREWYTILVHQGCTRNEYHEYRVEESDFGARGCLFFHLGCMGPLTYGPCNKLLRPGAVSNTRLGVPCVGCTRPDFPLPQPFFSTRKLEGVPLDLPVGVDRAHFLAYKTMAQAAAPRRLLRRENAV